VFYKERWRRGVVAELVPELLDDQMMEVALTDYGDNVVVSRNNVKTLKPEFSQTQPRHV